MDILNNHDDCWEYKIILFNYVTFSLVLKKPYQSWSRQLKFHILLIFHILQKRQEKVEKHGSKSSAHFICSVQRRIWKGHKGNALSLRANETNLGHGFESTAVMEVQLLFGS